MDEIPFSRPFVAGTELDYVRQAAEEGLASGGAFTGRCERWLAEQTGAVRAVAR